MLRENWYRDVWLILITGVVAWSLLSLQDRQDEAAQQRRTIAVEQARADRQFCQLIVRRVEDRYDQVDQTRSYVKSPLSQDDPNLRKLVLSFSLPQLERQALAERRLTPQICRPALAAADRDAGRSP